jgi:hypothetical protein
VAITSTITITITVRLGQAVVRLAGMWLASLVLAGLAAGPCDHEWPRTTHKLWVWVAPDAAADAGARAKAIAALEPFVFTVLADYGPGEDSPVAVEVDDEQRDVMARAGHTEDLDATDVVRFAGVAIDIAGRGRIEPPLRVAGWRLAARANAAVPYVIKPRAPYHAGPWWDELIAQLTAAGAAPRASLDGELVAVITPAQARAVAAIGDVAWLGRIEPLYKVSSGLLGADAECVWFAPEHAHRLAAAARPATSSIGLVVTALADTAALRRVISRAGGRVIESDEAGGLATLVIRAPRRAIRVLANCPDVISVGEALLIDEAGAEHAAGSRGLYRRASHREAPALDLRGDRGGARGERVADDGARARSVRRRSAARRAADRRVARARLHPGGPARRAGRGAGVPPRSGAGGLGLRGDVVPARGAAGGRARRDRARRADVGARRRRQARR